MTTRALVLGGGGPVGVAWETGLIAGFARAGVDLSQADYVLGTSAGSIVGARLRLTREPTAMADGLLAPRPPGAESAAGPAPDLRRIFELIAESQSGSRNPAQVRRELGELALAAQTMPPDGFLARIGLALGEPAGAAWPGRGFACTAVDTGDGGFQLWESGSGVELLPAIASSCAVPGVFPPVPILGRRYMDGGMRSVTNADLAAGYDVVVIIALQFARGGADLVARQLAEETESLQAGGATVVTITPDEASLAAMGSNLMDFGRNAPVASAGLAQAAADAAVLGPIWG
jgi:NTE family protein